MTPEQRARLPQYAQRRIAKLEADVEYYRDQAERQIGEGETDTFRRILNFNTGKFRLVGLPRGTTVVFPSAGIEVTIEKIWRTGKPAVRVQPTDMHEHTLSVNPGRGYLQVRAGGERG